MEQEHAQIQPLCGSGKRCYLILSYLGMITVSNALSISRKLLRAIFEKNNQAKFYN